MTEGLILEEGELVLERDARFVVEPTGVDERPAVPLPCADALLAADVVGVDDALAHPDALPPMGDDDTDADDETLTDGVDEGVRAPLAIADDEARAVPESVGVDVDEGGGDALVAPLAVDAPVAHALNEGAPETDADAELEVS